MIVRMVKIVNENPAHMTSVTLGSRTLVSGRVRVDATLICTIRSVLTVLACARCRVDLEPNQRNGSIHPGMVLPPTQRPLDRLACNGVTNRAIAIFGEPSPSHPPPHPCQNRAKTSRKRPV